MERQGDSSSADPGGVRRDEWSELAAELIQILEDTGPGAALAAEPEPLVPRSPLREAVPTAYIQAERVELPAEALAAREASLSELTRALLGMAAAGKFRRHHAFNMHPDSPESRLYRYDVEANRRLLESLSLPDPATLPPSSIERRQAELQAELRVAAAAAGVEAGPPVRRGVPEDLRRAAARNRHLLMAAGEVLPPGDDRPTLPRPLGRPLAPGEFPPVTPDLREVTKAPEQAKREAGGRPGPGPSL